MEERYKALWGKEIQIGLRYGTPTEGILVKESQKDLYLYAGGDSQDYQIVPKENIATILFSADSEEDLFPEESN